jgi:hypothetical protein
VYYREFYFIQEAPHRQLGQAETLANIRQRQFGFGHFAHRRRRERKTRQCEKKIVAATPMGRSSR